MKLDIKAVDIKAVDFKPFLLVIFQGLFSFVIAILIVLSGKNISFNSISLIVIFNIMIIASVVYAKYKNLSMSTILSFSIFYFVFMNIILLNHIKVIDILKLF